MRPSSLLLVFFLLPAAAWAAPPSSTPPGLQESIRFHQVPERLELPALDVAKLRAEDARDRAAGKPPRYAVPVKTAPVTPAGDGAWETLDDGSRVWRYRVLAKGATSVQPAFTDFRLPEGAALWVHGNEGRRVRGPYTREHNADHGELWVPVIEGERATIELVLEPGVSREAVELSMTRVLHGYDAFWKQEARVKDTNSCNVDVQCPAGEDWQKEIASVARITIAFGSRVGLCSGQMVNDTAFSGRPLFLTGDHCGIREDNAASVTTYWNFEHPDCRDIGDSPEPRTRASEQASLDNALSGARLLARYVSSDFSLLELSRNPDPDWEVVWTGWDRRDREFGMGVGIHHPQGEEKRISIEKDRLDIIDGDLLTQSQDPLLAPDQALPRSHLQVNDWDVGVTEGGSSGSGLWNGRHKLVGQLHGGARHTCGDDDFDYYGRFWMSWEGGGTADTSLEPWLDPLDSGAKTVEHRDGQCTPPDAAMADLPASINAGETVNLRATGGSSQVRFLWDIDGDGIVDAEGREVSASFPGAGERQVRLTASNPGRECGKTLEKTLKVQAPALKVANVGELVQRRGNGDGVIDPGERWGLRVSLANDGDARAVNPRAVFHPVGAGRLKGPDGFGYTAAGSQSSGNCPYRFADIRGTNLVDFQARSDSSFPDNDDGGSEAFPMEDFPFPFYENSDVKAMVMSSNGYLAPSSARTGEDWSNDCPLPHRADPDPGPSQFTGHARLAAFHDDLVTPRAFQERFETCPRPGDVPGGSGACRIFQWNNVDVLEGGHPFDPLPIPKFDFQAILYEGTGEIVYQYGPQAPTELSTPTVGIQDDRASQGLTWGCSARSGTESPARPAPASAVCFYHPDAQPKALDADVVSIATPALGYNNLRPGDNDTNMVVFEIDADAECGARFGIGLKGLHFDNGFSPGPGTILTGRVGDDDGECSPASGAASAKADIDFRPGMYFNPARDGHGVDIHSAGDRAFLVWFTYGPDRQPVWYLAAGPYRGDQIVADLLRFTEGEDDDPETVGQVVVTFLDETRALFDWTLDGEPGGEPFQYLKFGGDAPPASPTGHWFPPSQNGWGMTLNAQGDTEVGVVYFYDEQGQPVWALGQKDNPGRRTIDLDQFQGVCPGCDWAPQSARAAGTLTRDISDAENGSVETDITLKPPLEGSWPRGPVDIEILSDPVD